MNGESHKYEERMCHKDDEGQHASQAADKDNQRSPARSVHVGMAFPLNVSPDLSHGGSISQMVTQGDGSKTPRRRIIGESDIDGRPRKLINRRILRKLPVLT